MLLIFCRVVYFILLCCHRSIHTFRQHNLTFVPQRVTIAGILNLYYVRCCCCVVLMMLLLHFPAAAAAERCFTSDYETGLLVHTPKSAAMVAAIIASFMYTGVWVGVFVCGCLSSCASVYAHASFCGP